MASAHPLNSSYSAVYNDTVLSTGFRSSSLKLVVLWQNQQYTRRSLCLVSQPLILLNPVDYEKRSRALTVSRVVRTFEFQWTSLLVAYDGISLDVNYGPRLLSAVAISELPSQDDFSKQHAYIFDIPDPKACNNKCARQMKRSIQRSRSGQTRGGSLLTACFLESYYEKYIQRPRGLEHSHQDADAISPIPHNPSNEKKDAESTKGLDDMFIA